LKCRTSLVAEIPETRQHFFYFFSFLCRASLALPLLQRRAPRHSEAATRRPRASCGHGAVPPYKRGTRCPQPVGNRLLRLRDRIFAPSAIGSPSSSEKPIHLRRVRTDGTHYLNALIRRASAGHDQIIDSRFTDQQSRITNLSRPRSGARMRSGAKPWQWRRSRRSSWSRCWRRRYGRGRCRSRCYCGRSCS
jgi:hypothetical protein